MAKDRVIDYGDEYLSTLDKEIANTMDFVIHGNCDDYAHYRDLCGKVSGMRFAISEFKDLRVKELQDEDEVVYAGNSR